MSKEQKALRTYLDSFCRQSDKLDPSQSTAKFNQPQRGNNLTSFLTSQSVASAASNPKPTFPSRLETWEYEGPAVHAGDDAFCRPSLKIQPSRTLLHFHFQKSLIILFEAACNIKHYTQPLNFKSNKQSWHQRLKRSTSK